LLFYVLPTYNQLVVPLLGLVSVGWLLVLIGFGVGSNHNHDNEDE